MGCGVLRCTSLLDSELYTMFQRQHSSTAVCLVFRCYSPYAPGDERKGIMRKHVRVGSLLVDATAVSGRRAFLVNSEYPVSYWTICFVIRVGQVRAIYTS